MELFEKLLGYGPYKSETVQREGVSTYFFGDGGISGQAPKIELLEALDPDSPVARFLEKRGSGLHHVAFEVRDLKQEMARLRELGFQLLSDAPKPGADGKQIAFLHPKSTAGVLVELCESVRVHRQAVQVPYRDAHLTVWVSGPLDAPPLLVLHGALGSTVLETDRLVRHWEKTYRVYALDFMGHGDSAAFAEEAFMWTGFVDNVRAVLNHFALRRCHLFGFSMGAGVALTSALHFPDVIDRLAVHGVNVQWSSDEVDRMVAPMDPASMRKDRPFWAQRLADVHGADRWERLVEQIVHFTRELPERWMTADELQAVHQPTLVSHGDQDRFFDVRHAVALWRALPHTQLWILPGLDHPIQGLDASAFSASIDRFMDREDNIGINEG